MDGVAWLYLLAILLAAVLLFGTVYFIIMFSDLESDYINPIDLCNGLNNLVIPEHATHASLTFLFLISTQWLAVIINLPLVVFNILKITQKRHIYDATEIFRTVDKNKKEVYFKLAFYLLSFFYYLYGFIASLIAEGN